MVAFVMFVILFSNELNVNWFPVCSLNRRTLTLTCQFWAVCRLCIPTGLCFSFAPSFQLATYLSPLLDYKFLEHVSPDLVTSIISIMQWHLEGSDHICRLHVRTNVLGKGPPSKGKVFIKALMRNAPGVHLFTQQHFFGGSTGIVSEEKLPAPRHTQA